MMPTKTLRGKVAVKGCAEGIALVLPPFCFLGEVDTKTGKIMRGHARREGPSVSGRVLVYPQGKGSSGNARILFQLALHNKKPAAIILLERPDPTLLQGAIFADVPLMYDFDKNPLKIIKTGDFVTVDARARANGVVHIKENKKHLQSREFSGQPS